MPKSLSLCTACGNAVCVRERRQRKGREHHLPPPPAFWAAISALPKVVPAAPTKCHPAQGFVSGPRLSLQDCGQEHTRNQGEKTVFSLPKAVMKVFCVSL